MSSNVFFKRAGFVAGVWLLAALALVGCQRSGGDTATELAANIDPAWLAEAQSLEVRDLLSQQRLANPEIRVDKYGIFARISVSAPGYRDVAQWLEYPMPLPGGVEVLPEDPQRLRDLAWKDKKAPRLIILEFDGMTEPLFSEARARGSLPAFELLLEKGSWGPLESCCELASPSIWTTVATGLAPEEHGITDFVTTDPETGEMHSTTSEDVLAPRLWDILEAAQGGSVIAGALLVDESQDVFNHEMLSPMATDRIRRAMADQAPRLLVVYEPQVDCTQHLFWWTREPETFRKLGWRLSPGLCEICAGRLDQAYRVFDTWVAMALTLAGPDTVIVALSDHGFKQAPEKAQYNFSEERLFELLEVKGSRLNSPQFGEMLLCGDTKRDTAKIADSLRRMKASTGEKLFGSVRESADDRCPTGRRVRATYDQGAVAQALWGNAQVAWGDKTTSLRDLTYPGSSGDHKLHGLFFVAGAGVKPGAEVENASVFDLAPTSLAVLGLPAAEDMRGRIWQEAFTKPLPDRRIPTYGRRDRPPSPPGEPPSIERIKHLKSLGYL